MGITTIGIELKCGMIGFGVILILIGVGIAGTVEIDLIGDGTIMVGTDITIGTKALGTTQDIM